MIWRRVWLGCSSFGIDLSSPSVYGIRICANSTRVGARSTIWPAYMTAISSGPPGHDAEVVRDEHHRHVALALLLLQQVEDLGLHGDVERGRGLVGEQQLRAARERDGDHDALAHASGELVRVLRQATLGLGDADRLQQRERRVGRLLLVHVEVVAQRLGDLPTFSTGFSDVIGSWNTIAISVPQYARIALFDSVVMSSPSKRRCLRARRSAWAAGP